MYLLLLCLASLLLSVQTAMADPAPRSWLVGRDFTEALDLPLNVTWKNSELRPALLGLSAARRMAMVIDRRIDPNRVINLDASQRSFRTIVQDLVKSLEANVSQSEQFLYVGPHLATSRFRTLLVLRNDELAGLLPKLTSVRRKELKARHALAWEDLTAPQEIVERIAAKYKLSVQGLDLVPYDLWAQTDLPPIPITEALTVVLIQFDLTCRLNPSGTELQIIPIPEKLSLERTFTVPKAKATEVTQLLEAQAPQTQAVLRVDQVVAQGTLEQLEEVEQMIKLITTGKSPPKSNPNDIPLSRRKISFQAQNAPISAIMKKVEMAGVQFVYDPDHLKAAGIDLEKLVEIDVREVSYQQFFQQLLGNHGMTFEINKQTVQIKPVLSNEATPK